jgi:nicotinamidase-related amidase
MSIQNEIETSRSPWLLNADDSALLVIDMQEKLLPHIADHQRIVWNIGRLIEGARLLNVAIRATEQYPQGLGATVDTLGVSIRKSPPELGVKTMFSCRECASLFSGLKSSGVQKLVVTGIEAHVCVAQTVMDVIADGFDAYLCVDAIGSRFAVDRETALRRLENAGAIPTTTEAVLFEWCEHAKHPAFKQISQLVRKQHG